MTRRPQSQLVLATVLYEALGLVLVADWMIADRVWTSISLYAGLGLIILGVAMHLGQPWARIVGIILTSLLLVVVTVVFVLTVAGFGRFSAELEVAGLEFALPAHLVPWVSAFLVALFGWQIRVLFRRSTRTYFQAE